MDIKYSYQNNGESFMQLKIGKNTYTIRGYSRAALRTSIMIDELNIVFDMGYMNDRVYSYDNKLISHGHTDHIGNLHLDHNSRKMMHIEKMKLYIMPEQCIVPYKVIASAFSAMNSGRNDKNIRIIDNLVNTKIVSSEDCMEDYTELLHSEYVVRSFLMDHKVKSYGYIVYRKSKRLKQEYNQLNQKEIIELKKSGIELTDIHYTPLVGYTGDTTINGLTMNPIFFDVPLLIMECTGFSKEDKQQTIDGKHIHWDDIIINKHMFKNEKIILFHFSQKYKTLDDLLEYINDSMDNIYFFL